jgi:hypothetical protein
MPEEHQDDSVMKKVAAKPHVLIAENLGRFGLDSFVGKHDASDKSKPEHRKSDVWKVGE